MGCVFTISRLHPPFHKRRQCSGLLSAILQPQKDSQGKTKGTRLIIQLATNNAWAHNLQMGKDWLRGDNSSRRRPHATDCPR